MLAAGPVAGDAGVPRISLAKLKALERENRDAAGQRAPDWSDDRKTAQIEAIQMKSLHLPATAPSPAGLSSNATSRAMRSLSSLGSGSAKVDI